MAGNKKKKKPATNINRGFATTSIASKPRVTPEEAEAAKAGSNSSGAAPLPAGKGKDAATPGKDAAGPAGEGASAEADSPGDAAAAAQKKKEELSPEEFERQLEESELQLLVEKHAPKVRRDAQRQVARLETDRRLLRGQAEPIHAKKWLPSELMDDILDLLQSESRFAAASANSLTDNSAGGRGGGGGGGSGGNGGGKLLAEEDLTIRLWTLQETLYGAGFPREKAQAALKHVLDMSTQIGSAAKDSIWGLDEALDWLARECTPEELPGYTSKKAVAGNKAATDTPSDSPLASGAATPLLPEPESQLTSKAAKNTGRSRSPQRPKQTIITYHGDIEPEDLVPWYLEAKERLFAIQRPQQGQDAKKAQQAKQAKQAQRVQSVKRADEKASHSHDDSVDELEVGRLLGKLDRIQNDILFDKRLAEMQWRAKKVILEREYAEKVKAAAKKQREEAAAAAAVAAAAAKKKQQKGASSDDDSDSEDSDDSEESDSEDSDDGSVNAEAERVAAEILAQGQEDDSDGEAISDLFASLPVSEVDPETGKVSTVVNRPDGTKMVIRDFGEWTGVTPMRALDEACRSRDSSVKIAYRLVSEASFASQHLVVINWAKAQEVPPRPPIAEVESSMQPSQFVFKMSAVATPDAKQSEAFVATAALFFIFGASPKEEKVAMRLPHQWRDLWAEFAEAKKSKADAEDRTVVKELRGLVRQRRDQDLEDGVVLAGAFRGRGGGSGGAGGKGSGPGDGGNGSGSGGGDVSSERGAAAAAAAAAEAERLKQLWQDKSSSPRYQAMLRGRMQLPMWAFREQVLATVDREQVVIVCGETGCGKSTQVPSFLLEHQLAQGKACKVYCTEPRRISAISLAKRVSEELGEARNELGTARSLVGYAIRLEAKTGKETRLVYATTGIVMRMLEGSNELREITHLVLDEVHERTIDSDFLLIVLKRLLPRRPDLKVVLMSATVDAERFSQYLGGAPVLNVPGRTFPVQVQYLEDAVELTGYSVDVQGPGGPGGSSAVHEKTVSLGDDDDDDDSKTLAEAEASAKPELIKTLKGYSARTRTALAQMDEYQIPFDLIVQLVLRLAHDPQLDRYSKAILVFLPGLAEIRALNDLLLGEREIGGGPGGNGSGSSSWQVFPLHSTIATEDQEAAFVVPPPGVRKIVLATNIAETGITIPDVTCVIDTGKHREMRFDEKRQLSRLIDTFISRANAKQRRGRAGRVQEGLCFHLFTRYRHDRVLSDQQTPEMLRLSLQDLAIRVKMCRIGAIEETLGQALDPPSPKNIRRAIDALVDARALTIGSSAVGPGPSSTGGGGGSAGGSSAAASSGLGPVFSGGVVDTEELTPLGRQLARLPLDVFLGKLVLLGTVFKCLDMALTVAAILSAKSPFVAPFGQRAQADAVRRGFRRGDSDLLTVYNAYCAWKQVCQSAAAATSGQEFQFCRKNFLSPQILANIEDLKGQLLVSLVDSGFLPLTEEERRNLSQKRYQGGGGGGRGGAGRRRQVFFDLPHRVNLHSDVDVVAQAVIAWSFYPKLLVRDSVAGSGNSSHGSGGHGLRNIGNNQAIRLHPSSVNRGRTDLRWLSYYHIMQSKSLYNAHEITAVEAFPLALLCGDVRCDMYSGVLVLDGNRARFSAPDWKYMLVVKTLRARLREMLARAFKAPGKPPTAQQERWFDVWQRIFTQEFADTSGGGGTPGAHANTNASKRGGGRGGRNAGRNTGGHNTGHHHPHHHK